MLSRSDKLLILWVLACGAIAGTIGPNLHALLGCRCQPYALTEFCDLSQIFGDTVVDDLHDPTAALRGSQGTRQPPLATGDCPACTLLARFVLRERGEPAGLAAHGGPRHLFAQGRQIVFRTFALCVQPRGPPATGPARSIS